MTSTWLPSPLALCRRVTRALEALQPAALLAARIYVGSAFFKSGLTKLVDWETTLALFQDEYKVPLLPPHWAAVMGTVMRASHVWASTPAELWQAEQFAWR